MYLSRSKLAITGNPHLVVHDEDMSDWSFVDTIGGCGLSMARGAEEAPAGVGEQDSNWKREEIPKEV